MSEEAKKIVRKYRMRNVLYFLYAFGIMILFLVNPADYYTYEWPWFEYNIYTIICLIALIALEIIGALVYHYFELKFCEIVNEKCDPFLFEECLGKMKLQHLSKNVYYYNMANLYMYQGAYDTAWEWLMKIKASSLRGPVRENYYVVKCALLYEFKMIDQINAVESEARQGIRNQKDEAVMNRIYAQNNFYRAYLNKDYEAAYQFLADVFKYVGPVKYMIQKIYFTYWTGVLDREMGNIISAKANFRFVIENGNKLKCAEYAKQMLEELETE